MGLEVPELDDRTFEELLTDARKRIPVHSETWTDHNLSDPGITMLEVLAWVAESDIYQLDRVTDRHVRKYLRLLGVEPRGPQPATVRLEVDPSATDAGRIREAGTELSVTEAGTERRFETRSSVALTDAGVAAVVSDTRGGRVDNTAANDREGLHFEPFGPEAAEGNAVYLGFDSDPFDAGRLDLFVDYHDADLPAPAEHGNEEPTFEPSASVEWGYYTGGSVYEPGNWPAWTPEDVDDGTAELYYRGTVSLPEPPDWDRATASDLFDREESLYWLRARVTVAEHEIPPRVNAFETGVVEAVHRVRYEDERLGRVPEGSSADAARNRDDPTTTSARPGQEFVFDRAPVLAASVRVDGDPWEEVEDFDASGPDDRHYVLDRERGVARFGDGVRGEVPEPDQEVWAAWYDHGGGEAGNVGGDADWAFDDDSVQNVAVSARGPAAGGADAEPTDVALARLKSDLRTPYRAVTAEDVRYLATHTPGLRFGRAAVRVEERDDEGDDCARHAELRVAVVPYSPRDRPEASDGFLEAVSCHLQEHRLLTDELIVETPPYVPVDVEAEIEIADGYAVDRRVEAVRGALGDFLDPLEGFDGSGWPFGRPVYRSEVYERVEGVEGVDCVVDIELRADDPGFDTDTGIGVPGTALVFLDDATVTVSGSGDRCGRRSG
jgi:predicted phage baseplate assembly protein